MESRKYTFDSVQVGLTLGPVEHELTEDYVRDYLAGTGAEKPLLDKKGRPLAPPAMTTIFSTALLSNAGGSSSGGIHAKQQFRFLRPFRVGTKVTTTGRVVEKFVRNGRKTVVYEAITRDAANQELARCVVTSILPA